MYHVTSREKSMQITKPARSKLACIVLVVLVLFLGRAGATPAKNIIIMIGDGMGVESVKAGRYYLYGADGQLCFEPYYKCSLTTYCLDSGAHPVTDSAAAGSALATGHKVNYLAISQSPEGVPWRTILEEAKALGKRTGLIGTDPITRATPAAFGAHEPHRDSYDALAGDYLSSSLPDVLMGGGGTSTGTTFFSNARISQAQALGYQTVYTKAQMDVLSNSTSRVLGLYTLEDMSYEYDRRQNPNTTEPHLSEMTAKTLALLDTDPDGFFLMVEGAKIDYAGHQLPAYPDRYLTWEVVAFNQAVQTVLNWMQARENALGYQDTLLIVTADHETGGVTSYNNGAGAYPTVTFSTNQHTGVNVPLYAVGSNAHLVDDYVSGGVMDNTNVHTVMSRAFTGAPYWRVPYKIYDQFGMGTGGEGNVYYGSGVFDGTAYLGQITNCAQQWRDHQIDGNAMMNHTPKHVPSDAIAKCCIPMNGFPAAGGWLYIGGGGTGLYRTSSWSSTNITKLTVPNAYVPESICTDGTHIYMTSGTANQQHKIFRYSINHSTGVLTSVASWPVTIGTTSTVRLRALSYYDSKIYAVNHKGTGNQIYEIDIATRAVATLGKVPVFGANADNAYQCVRYGDQLFIVGLDDNLHTYQLSGTTWTHVSSVDLGLTDLYGIAVKGDGTKAQYAWIPHLPGKVAFYALDPWTATPTNLADAANWANNNGYPIHLGDAVVTAVNPSQAPTGFWVQNRERTIGAHVLWGGTMPAVNHRVNIISGNGTSTPSGERTFTASAVTPHEPFEAKPLLMAHKSIAPAAGSVGLATDGLLVKICGRVTGHNSETGAFYIDDGSGVPTGVTSPLTGVKVLKADGSDMRTIANYQELVLTGTPCIAAVTGVARLESSGGIVTRRIDARNDTDIAISPL